MTICWRRSTVHCHRVYDPTTGQSLSQDPLFYPATRPRILLGAFDTGVPYTGIGTNSNWETCRHKHPV